MNILVLCTGNSARSILLESIFNTRGAGRVRAFSAGSQPTGMVHPQSLALLDELGHDTSHARSKSWDEFATPDAPHMDMVITVCGSAAGETCPMWPSKSGRTPLRAHWGVDDPAALDEPDWDTGFRTAFAMLDKRAAALLDLPIETMTRDDLQIKLNNIGNI